MPLTLQSTRASESVSNPAMVQGQNPEYVQQIRNQPNQMLSLMSQDQSMSVLGYNYMNQQDPYNPENQIQQQQLQYGHNQQQMHQPFQQQQMAPQQQAQIIEPNQMAPPSEPKHLPPPQLARSQQDLQLTLQKVEIDMKHENQSLVTFIDYCNEIELREPLKSKIKDNEMLNYFNYSLNTTNWNMIVNKQIFMKFERLLIEK